MDAYHSIESMDEMQENSFQFISPCWDGEMYFATEFNKDSWTTTVDNYKKKSSLPCRLTNKNPLTASFPASPLPAWSVVGWVLAGG